MRSSAPAGNCADMRRFNRSSRIRDALKEPLVYNVRSAIDTARVFCGLSRNKMLNEQLFLSSWVASKVRPRTGGVLRDTALGAGWPLRRRGLRGSGITRLWGTTLVAWTWRNTGTHAGGEEEETEMEHVMSAIGDLLGKALVSIIDDGARASTARGEVYEHPCFVTVCYSRLRFVRVLLQSCDIDMAPPPKGWRESINELYVKHVKGGESQSIGRCALLWGRPVFDACATHYHVPVLPTRSSAHVETLP
jgi:hypothetical protein